MTNPTTTAPADEQAGHQPLRAALVRAWHATTWTGMPEAWLDAAVTALTTPPPDGDGHRHGELGELAACHEQTAAELRRLRAATSTVLAAVAHRHQQLDTLRAQVRQRAINTLVGNPELADALREALAAWGLPPIPTDFTVEVNVPMTVRVSAVDEANARREAATLLAQRLGGLGHALFADTASTDYVQVTNE